MHFRVPKRSVLTVGLLRPQAANLFEAKRNKENAEKLAKERELQKVQVKKEDIELIVSNPLDH